MNESSWRQDLARYGGRKALIDQPALWAIGVYRFGVWARRGPRWARRVLSAPYFISYSLVRLLTGIDIPRSARIGPGLLIHHFGGIIIHPQAVVGSNCTLRHGVTIGARDASGPATVGNDVVIGAYAQILGSVKVGDRATIGALTLVIKDVPVGATVVGIPAKEIAPRA